MTPLNPILPPLLEKELFRTLKRYRRLRLLRASMKFFIVLLPSLCAAGGLAFLWLPLSPLVLAGALVCLVAFVGLWAFWPVFARPLSLRDVASFIDQQHPDLQDRVLSAVVLSENADAAPSAWMLEHFLTEAQQQVKGIPLDDFMCPWELRSLVGGVTLCVALCLAGALGAAWKLGFIRSADSPEQLATTRFDVKPGDAVVQPGDNQIVWVTTSDTASAKYIYWEQGGTEHRAVLQPSTTPEVSYHTFSAMEESLHYQVRVGGVESARFELRVHRPPAVESIHARYTYPAYLGIEPASVPYSGELDGVEGTRVTLRVEANKPVESVRLLREAGEELALSRAGENHWETTFELTVSDTYHLTLRDVEGNENPDPEHYTIRVTPDNPPELRVKYPRGDAKVLALEEVPFAFEVEDDFGIDGYGIEYTLAGKEPVRLALNTPGQTIQEAVGEHLLALEELGLAEGDLITWSVWATDKKPGRADYETSGDPYFLEVRPYTLRYREQLSQGGGQAPAGEGDAAMDQKKIIIALTNLRKTAKSLSEEPYTESLGRIAESQTKLRDELAAGLAEADPEEQQIGAEALGAMDDVLMSLGSAAWPEPEVALGEGLKPAQKAWQAMLKLEPELREVSRQQGGGAGAGQQELDALEMGQRKDYVEEASTGAAENEAVRNALDDLARRQELLNQDLGKLISEDEQAKAEEEKKRQLERLKEEQQRQMERLDEIRNQVASSEMKAAQRDATKATLDQAREAMERSMESVREEALQEARASGSRAAQNLADAESALEQLSRDGTRERFAGLEEKVKSLQERQAAIQEETKTLKEAQAAPGVEGHDDWAKRTESLKDEKESMAGATKEMLEGAGGLSDQLRENQELLSRKLGDWVRRTSRTGVVEDMEEGLPLVEYGVWDAAERQEGQVKTKIDEAARTLEELKQFLPGASDDAMARALDMLSGLEREKDEQQSSGESGENGSSPEEQAAGQPSPGAGPSTEPRQGEPTEGTPTAGQPGDAAGQQPGVEQPEGVSPGSGAESGGEPQLAQGNGSEGQPGSATGGTGGGDEGSVAGGTPMNDFFDGEARTWRPVLRDAASLLPRESEMRQSLEQVETDLGRLQREYDHSKKLPKLNEFEQVVRRPLLDTIAALEEVVRAKAAGEAFWLEDEGAIPEQYVDRVAEYFRLLAEEPAKP
jgi:hypothetical protein